MPVLFTSVPGIQGVPTTQREMQEMTDYYYQTLQNKNDALYAWVSVKEVFDLIIANPGATGIRIYYGRHKDDKIINGKNYKGIHGVILVTTQDGVDQHNPTIENSINILINNVSAVSYTGNADDNIPTKPPHGVTEQVTF